MKIGNLFCSVNSRKVHHKCLQNEGAMKEASPILDIYLTNHRHVAYLFLAFRIFVQKAQVTKIVLSKIYVFIIGVLQIWLEIAKCQDDSKAHGSDNIAPGIRKALNGLKHIVISFYG